MWALLGVLKAGAAFTIVDPAYPAARFTAHLQPSRPRGLVQIGSAGSAPGLLETFLASADCRCRVTLLPLTTAQPRGLSGRIPDDRSLGHRRGGRCGLRRIHLGIDRRAEGIVGRHGPLTHFLPWLVEKFTLGPEDRFSMLSGLSHDPLQRDSSRRCASGRRFAAVPPTTTTEERD